MFSLLTVIAAAISAFAFGIAVMAFALGIRYDVQLAANDETIADLRAQLADWKGKAERLMDAALVRAGAIHQPTLEDRKLPTNVAGAASLLSSALAIQEIDSSKRKAS